jgi:hypothetical protein
MEESPAPDLAAELDAMAAVHTAVRDLTSESQKRVLRWAMSAFGVISEPGLARPASFREAGDERSATASSSDYTAFADLLGDSGASTDADRALVGGYWLQVILGNEDFTSQSVNEELKNTGNAIGNITRAFDNLKNAKPQLVRQLLKAGRAQQARKKLKLTTAGIDRVRRMISGDQAE